MLKQRIITALILIPLVVALVVYLPPPSFCFLTGVVMLGGAWEWSNLMQLQKISSRLCYLSIVVLMFVATLFIPIPAILLAAFVWWLIASTLVILYPRVNAWWSKSVVLRGLMGLFVLVPCWAAINSIRNERDGIFAILYLFVLIWGADTAAYFVGKKWGKTKLAPVVSPGKSLQGVCGALLFAALFGLFGLYMAGVTVEFWFWGVTLSVVTVIFSIMGDLFESMMKREAGLKDSGSLLPGHGGLLDRIDSLTAAAPVFAFGALLLAIYLE